VQTIIPLDQTSAVKLTTARYFTPSGRSIQAEGILPDIVLDQVELRQEDGSGLKPLKEADLARHLEREDDDEAGTGVGAEDAGTEKSLAETDFQLSEALNLLKGLYIMRQPRST
jgi:carboxyl-terminal processing protease